MTTQRLYVLMALIALVICLSAAQAMPDSGSRDAGPVPTGTGLVEGRGQEEGAAAGVGVLSEDLLKDWYWRLLGPSMPAGRAWTVVGVESDPTTLYVTTASGGLWKSMNNGTTFEPVFDHEGSASTGAVAIAPSNPDIVWVGTGEPANTRANSWGDGVYKSSDGGATWTNMGLRDSRMTGHILIHPENPDIVYVAAMGRLWGRNEERGIFKTVDGGESWRKVLYIDDTTGFNDIQMHPADPDVLLAAAWQRFRYGGGDMAEAGPGSGIFKSTDGGETWERLENGLPTDPMGKIHIAIARNNPDIVYANILTGEPAGRGQRTSDQGGLFRSDDGGDSWTRVNDRQTSYYYNRVYVDPNDDETVWMPVYELNRSRDGGRTFEEVNMRHVHNDLHSMWIDPHDSTHFLLSGDGGVNITYDGGRTYQQAVLPIGQFYETAVDTANPYHVFGGMQDTGHWRGPVRTYDEEGITAFDWIKLRYVGDGMAIATDPRDPNVLFMAQQFGNTSRLDLTTWNRTELQPSDPDELRSRGARNEMRWDWSPALALSKHDPDFVFLGSNYLFRIHGPTGSWELISPDLTRQQGTSPRGISEGYHSYGALFSVAESPLDAEMLWAGADDGPIWVTRDGGTHWTRVDVSIPGPALMPPESAAEGSARVATASEWGRSDSPGLDPTEPQMAHFRAAPYPPSRSAIIANVTGMLPMGNWPTPCVVAEIEPSRFARETAYVAYDCHKLDDVRPYLFKTTDAGRSWRSINGDLPDNGSSWVIREDPRHPDVLYAGTELGIFVTIDGGVHWARLKGNLPTVGTRSLAIQEREQDLVAATYGRSIWVTDISPFAEMAGPSQLAVGANAGGEALAKPLHLFAPEPVTLFKTRVTYGNTIEELNGDMFFRAANPPDGAIITYYLRDGIPGDVRIEIFDTAGNPLRTLRGPGEPGMHQVVWDLKSDETAAAQARRGMTPSEADYAAKVAPGRYSITVTAGDLSETGYVNVRVAPPATRERF
jgi:photosystem II stability/assembly factor-like uncharacterized protein